MRSPNFVVKTTPGGAPVRVGDVAIVRPSVMPVYTVVTANAKPAVLLNVYRQPDSNSVDVPMRYTRKWTGSVRSCQSPSAWSRSTIYPRSSLRPSIASATRSCSALLLASLIMVLFLRDWGTSLVAGLVIPATIAVTFIVLRALNESFNLMTLGGLAAAVGLVIDDAIVVVENIVLHRDSGQSRAEAIRSAIAEIRTPLVGSTITPIVVFLPLISIMGLHGVFFRALAVTVAVSLLTSLALALTWTPTLSHYLIRRHGKTGAPARHDQAPQGLMRVYERTLRFVLEHPLILAVFSIALIGGTYVAYQHTGSDLLPSMDEGGFIVDYIMPAGSSLAETNRVITHVDQILRRHPDVENTTRRTGMELGLAAVTEANKGDMTVRLKRDRKHTSEEVISEVRVKIKKAEPTLDVDFPQRLQDMIGDLTSSPEPVVIKMFAQDPEILKAHAPRVAAAIKKIPGVVDVFDGIENTISGPARIFNVDPAVTARAGFTPQEVEINASAMLQGEPAPPPVVVNDRAYPIRIRFPEQTRTSLDAIRNTLVVSGTGKTATIGSLTSMTEIPGQSEIRRENLQRDVQVTGRFEGINLGTA